MPNTKTKSDHRVVTAGQAPSRVGANAAPPGLLLPLRILAALGLAVGVYLSILHYHAGSSGVIDSPLCAISATLNCNAVLGSTYARLFKIPVATWAALTYALILGVSFLSNLRLLTLLCYWAFAFSVYMAGISLFSIKSACLFCMTLYAINTGLFVCAVLLARVSADFQVQQLLYKLAACAVLVVGLAWWQTRAPAIAASRQPEWFKNYLKQRKVALQAAERYTKGQPVASVTISEFVDFRCPACARLREALTSVLEKHATDARVVFHHYPLDNECNPSLPQQVHAASCLASYAAECAGEQGKFWEYADQLFMNQNRVYSRPDLEVYANTVGLNVNDFNACMNAGRTKQFVRNDIEEAHRIGVNSTPTLVINGRVLPGAPTPEQFAAIIDYEKQQAGTK